MDKYIIIFDEDTIYYTDLKEKAPYKLLNRGFEVLEFDSKEDMESALHSEKFEDYWED